MDMMVVVFEPVSPTRRVLLTVAESQASCRFGSHSAPRHFGESLQCWSLEYFTADTVLRPSALRMVCTVRNHAVMQVEHLKERGTAAANSMWRTAATAFTPILDRPYPATDAVNNEVAQPTHYRSKCIQTPAYPPYACIRGRVQTTIT